MATTRAKPGQVGAANAWTVRAAASTTERIGGTKAHRRSATRERMVELGAPPTDPAPRLGGEVVR